MFAALNVLILMCTSWYRISCDWFRNMSILGVTRDSPRISFPQQGGRVSGRDILSYIGRAVER